MKRFMSFVLAAILILSVPSVAISEVRFGKNVRIGGHDVSGQTFNKKKRGKFYIYKNRPKNAGCRWRKNKDGSRTKICDLKRKK